MRKPISYCNIADCNARCVGRGLCRKHYMRAARHDGDPLATPRFDPLPVRFWRHVNKTDGCWLWTGAVARNYGHFTISQNPTKTKKAHRFAYELLIGPIPDGLTVDHLCRTTLCVRPDHMELVTAGVNTLRGTSPAAINAAKAECKRGHAFSPDNTHITQRGARRCRVCDRDWMRAYRESITSRE